MKTEDILLQYHKELYNFILKKVESEFFAEEIFQNSFVKIHQNLVNLNDESKARAWSYAIVRNEIVNALKNKKYYDELTDESIFEISDQIDVCCLPKFILKLPDIYKDIIIKIYVDGKSQKEVAKENGISLPNVKVRLKRAKNILTSNFVECCRYEIDSKGRLRGESKCEICG
jgi:RNA polymerase sigma-70 factor (ECF subfamily)